MNMSIENQREPLNPCTLIALKILSDFLGETLKKSNLEDAYEIVEAEKALREIEEGYLTDLLWGRLTFKLTDTNPQPPVFPPILDILQICTDARIKDMRCNIYVTNQEKHEYQKTVSLGFLRMIKHVLPDGADEQTQEQSLALWHQLEDGPIFTNLGEADHLCSSLVIARQEVIGRDHHQNMEDNPHKDPSIGTTDRFLRHNPIRLLFLSSPQKTQKAFSEALDQYLIDFQRKRIKWDANILPYNRQTVTLFSIFSRKQELFGDSFWFSEKDFSAIDPLVLDGYKPIETLLILARQKRIDVHEANRMEGLSTIRLRIKMNMNVEPKKKEEKAPDDKEDEAQKSLNQFISINAKRKILAQIILDYSVFQDDKGVIVIDPSELIASIPNFSRRGLHDLCQLMEKEGYFKKFSEHYPRSKIEREHPWDYIGPSSIDPYDRIMRISIVPDIAKLENLALLAPVDEESKFASPASEGNTGDKFKVNGIEVDMDHEKISYLGITEQYTLGKLPWQIIQRCASGLPDGIGKVAVEHLPADEITLSRALSRINKPWKSKNIRILYMKGGFIFLDPLQGTDVEVM